MAELWDDYTDVIITSIDESIKGKYKFSLRDILTNPSEFSSQPNIQTDVANMSNDVDNFIDNMLSSLNDEKKALDENLSKADDITKQLAKAISMYAKQNKIPFGVPVSLNRDETKDEVITVDSADSDVLALAEKLVASSTMVMDFTYKYGKSEIGSWFFSGMKNYVLDVYLPENNIIMLNASRDEIKDILNTSLMLLQGS